MSAPLTVALLGGGTVGGSVATLMAEQADELAARIGRPLQLTGVAVRNTEKKRPGIDQSLITDDALKLAASGADIEIGRAHV